MQLILAVREVDKQVHFGWLTVAAQRVAKQKGSKAALVAKTIELAKTLHAGRKA